MPQDGPHVKPLNTSPDLVPDSALGRAGAMTERSDGIPCLYSNNCIETNARTMTGSERDVVNAAYSFLSPYHKKQADRLYRNTERLISLAPSIGHVAFFTLTFPEKVYDYKEATRRWHSLNTNYLKPHPEFGIWERVGEQHKDGAWHFHCLIHVAQDIRTGFDFDEYLDWLQHHKNKKPGSPRRRLKTGSVYLRSLWADLRQNLQKYRFGISELIPLRKNEEAVARYVGKYVSKHLSQRTEKGARIISYSGDWTKHSMQMAWYNHNSILWRTKLALFAQYHGCTEFYQLADKLGPNWAYLHAEEIRDIEKILEENGGVCASSHQDQTLSRAEASRMTREAADKESPNLISRKSKARKSREAAKCRVSRILSEPPELPDLPPVSEDIGIDLKREWLAKLDAVPIPELSLVPKPQPNGVPF